MGWKAGVPNTTRDKPCRRISSDRLVVFVQPQPQELMSCRSIGRDYLCQVCCLRRFAARAERAMVLPCAF